MASLAHVQKIMLPTWLQWCAHEKEPPYQFVPGLRGVQRIRRYLEGLAPGHSDTEPFTTRVLG